MSINNQTLEQLEYLLSKLMKKYPVSEENKVMTDISFQAFSYSGDMTVLDDDDELIASTVIPEWINYTSEDFNEVVIATLKEFINSKKSVFDELAILHPYSILLVDGHKETIAELYEVDDESIMIDHEDLMKGLSQDLDSFIDKLLNS